MLRWSIVQTKGSRAAIGALIAGSLVSVLLLMLAVGSRTEDRCQLLVATPCLVFAVAGPTYLAGRATSARGNAVAFGSMLFAALVAYFIVGATWAVWGFAAQ
jgi:hypothetical protein